MCSRFDQFRNPGLPDKPIKFSDNTSNSFIRKYGESSASDNKYINRSDCKKSYHINTPRMFNECKKPSDWNWIIEDTGTINHQPLVNNDTLNQLMIDKLKDQYHSFSIINQVPDQINEDQMIFIFPDNQIYHASI